MGTELKLVQQLFECNMMAKEKNKKQKTEHLEHFELYVSPILLISGLKRTQSLKFMWTLTFWIGWLFQYQFEGYHFCNGKLKSWESCDLSQQNYSEIQSHNSKHSLQFSVFLSDHQQTNKNELTYIEVLTSFTSSGYSKKTALIHYNDVCKSSQDEHLVQSTVKYS